jgi:hypothetical protein
MRGRDSCRTRKIHAEAEHGQDRQEYRQGDRKHGLLGRHCEIWKRIKSHSNARVFTQSDGTPWTSKFFCRRFLSPSLQRQRAAGDPYLHPFNGSPGNTLEAKFWSLHCYRRGARSHVSRGGKFGKKRLRRATKDEVYEHGHWRRRRSGEDIIKSIKPGPSGTGSNSHFIACEPAPLLLWADCRGEGGVRILTCLTPLPNANERRQQ